MKSNSSASYIYSVDNKGRVAIPANIRKKFFKENAVIVTKGIEKCIWLFPLHEWEKFEERLKDFDMGDMNLRMATRWILGEAEECEIDSQGRILVPKALLDYAEIKDKCRFIKMHKWIEIWNPENYEEQSKMVLEKIKKGEIRLPL